MIYTRYYFLASFLLIFLLFLWYYALGIGFINNVQKLVRLNINTFKVWFLICCSSLIIIVILLIGSASTDQFVQIIILCVQTLCLVYLVSYIYLIWIIARAISIWEMNGDGEFTYYIGKFFLLWVFPLGLWAIQSKANKMINGEIGPFQIQDISKATSDKSEYYCSACGADVVQGQKKCNNCGEIFE